MASQRIHPHNQHINTANMEGKTTRYRCLAYEPNSVGLCNVSGKKVYRFKGCEKAHECKKIPCPSIIDAM